MKITKFKKNKNQSYTLFLENGEELNVYEEVILKYELLLSKTLNDKKKQALLQENVWWDAYYQAIRMIKVKARTTKEITEELLKKGYLQEDIEEVISKLVSQNYLDDKRYADSYLHMQMNTTAWGPGKIKSKLLQKGVPLIDIEEVLTSYTKDIELEKIKKLVAKGVRANHSKSQKMLKQKMKDTLQKEGFNMDLIQQEISKLSLEDDSLLREKEYNKLKRKLMRKYEGQELEQQIQRKLYQKGFTSNE